MVSRLFGWLLCAGLLTLPAAPAQSGDSQATRAETERIVREYLKAHPEVIIEALQAYQNRQRLAQQQQAREAIAAQQAELYNDASSPTAGSNDKDAITIVEFFDYRCGYCKHVLPVLSKLISSNPKVRVVFKDFPILGPDSQLAARAALASARQGAYFKYHQALLQHTGAFTPEALSEIATKLGLDAKRLRAEMESEAVAKTLEENMKLAESIGVESTPSFVAGTELVAGAMDEAGFAALLARSSGATPRGPAQK